MIEQELWNEEESDKRMNVIAQNGNDGLHYSEEDSDPYAEALNTVNECLVKLAERTQIIEEYVSEAQTLDKIQYTPKDSDQKLNFFAIINDLYEKIEIIDKKVDNLHRWCRKQSKLPRERPQIMAMYRNGIEVKETRPKKTNQGNGAHTKYSATSRNRKKKPYRGQGK